MKPLYRSTTFAIIVIFAICFILGAILPLWLESVSHLGRFVPTSNIRADYFAGCVWSIILGLSIFWWPVSSSYKLLAISVWSLRCVYALGVKFLTYSTGAPVDAFRYFAWGTDPLQRPFANFRFDLGDEGNHQVLQLVWLHDQIGPSSFFVISTSFSYLSLIGAYALWRAMERAFNVDDKRLGLLMMCTPSLLYWTTAIGKESIVLLGVAIYAIGCANLMARQSVGAVVLILVGLSIACIIRPWYGLILILPLGILWLLSTKGPVNRIIGGVAFLVVAGLAWNLLQYGSTIGSPEAAMSTYSDLSHSWAPRGSTGREAPQFQGLASFAINLVPSSFSALLRPLPGEFLSPLGIVTGFENLLMLLLLARAIFTRGHVIARNPVVLWAVLVIVFWTLVHSMVTNMGSTLRYRAPVLPIFLALLFVLNGLGGVVLHSASQRPAAFARSFRAPQSAPRLDADAGTRI
jgi:hypothetical protein